MDYIRGTRRTTQRRESVGPALIPTAGVKKRHIVGGFISISYLASASPAQKFGNYYLSARIEISSKIPNGAFLEGNRCKAVVVR